ncbi:putative O-glycosylation ligase, exosortase A system-associated [Rhizorhabdus dicambivorans]|uniref:Putative O-glycosylation ligase, exosortase A system-associated n=1 Tax=Rhizorhabdus dicambivorans TaxID=1850238 RepID=A0A2A4G0S9_9SPHN|nr:putative O-glycosylation ligase, exosortase A system-associated [Rhizorhabdus dicambivorans]ATE64815.1 putative O-glycosylation ligase, exosortase A system-associated [Rhizorhabdus dicambivorans]PCE44091.1 putative O-glycosylation ligase, exosortase A system-associated [Rhizorhabdus dicambivorans]
MRDLFLIGFLVSLLLAGFRRPFLFVCAYIYVDIVSPQRLSYYLLSSIPVSLIVFIAAFLGWAMNDDKSLAKPSPRQVVLILLLLLCGYTTLTADHPDAAMEKWDWVWKALVFSIFLPMTLFTRARIEGVLLFMLLCLSSIAVVGGAKTLAGGGGYGTLNLMVANNSGMYESSTISAFAICSIPLILYMAKYSTLVPPSIFARVYWYALAFACLLIPIGTQTRTGLLCIVLMALLELRAAKRRMLYLGIMVGIVAAGVPFLPKSYTERMDTIQGYQADASASTRLAVWKWTINYAGSHPFGGGFNAYIGNKLEIDMSYKTADGTVVKVVGYDQGRSFHNAYFEMLGEQGYPGLALFLIVHLVGIFRMEIVRRAYKKEEGPNAWVAPLAAALQHAHLIFMLGCSFVGIAFQPYIYFIIAVEIAFDRYVQTYVKKKVWNPFRRRRRDIEAAEAKAAIEAEAAAEAAAAESEPEPDPEPTRGFARAGEHRRTQPRWGTTSGK